MSRFSRDKVCALFVFALSDGFMKRELQMEEVTSLRMAIEREKEIKLIQKNNYQQKRENSLKFKKKKENNNNVNKKGKTGIGTLKNCATKSRTAFVFTTQKKSNSPGKVRSFSPLQRPRSAPKCSMPSRELPASNPFSLA